MNNLTIARLLITAVGIVVWGYGTKVDNATLRIVGMSLLAVSLILRFARRFLSRKEPPAAE